MRPGASLTPLHLCPHRPLPCLPHSITACTHDHNMHTHMAMAASTDASPCHTCCAHLGPALHTYTAHTGPCCAYQAATLNHGLHSAHINTTCTHTHAHVSTYRCLCMPSTVPTPEPYTMHTYVCLPHTSTSVPTQAPAVPTTLDWIMHTSSPHTYSHRHDIVSTYRCIAMPFTSAPLSLHHAHSRASLTALTPIYTHTAPCHAYHTRSRDLGPAWEYML